MAYYYVVLRPYSRSPRNMEPTPVGSSPNTPFERFKDLTRKLIKVPKEELQAELDKEKARKVKPVVDVHAPQGN